MRTRYLIAESTNPYQNFAVEEYLLTHVEPGECILFLWQNKKTVVIGRNQNPWRECRLESLAADGGSLARRMSGGGAVFHDLGNLNFTFLVRRDGYDVQKQTEVILQAVRSFGIGAVRTGRNDLAVEDRKFSGNAFYKTGDFCYHHGTVLVKSDKEELGRYLKVSREKLRSKGVESVKSRVANLTEYAPQLKVEPMRQALVSAFGEEYKSVPAAIDMADLPAQEIKAGEARFASWDWLYGRKILFNVEASGRYDWGEVQVRLEVLEGVIRDALVWTDALDIELPQVAQRALVGVRYRDGEIRRAFDRAAKENETLRTMLEDLATCMAEKRDGKG